MDPHAHGGCERLIVPAEHHRNDQAGNPDEDERDYSCINLLVQRNITFLRLHNAVNKNQGARRNHDLQKPDDD